MLLANACHAAATCFCASRAWPLTLPRPAPPRPRRYKECLAHFVAECETGYGYASAPVKAAPAKAAAKYEPKYETGYGKDKY